MNPTHIHLVITHLPIFGSILGAFVLAQGLWTKSNPTKIAAYSLLILSALGACTAYVTGESAEESVENVAGVAESMIEQHEEFAIVALISLIVLGAASVIGLILTFKESAMTRSAAFVIFVISLISFGLAARTGYLGGQIRHTEIHAQGTIQDQNEEDDD